MGAGLNESKMKQNIPNHSISVQTPLHQYCENIVEMTIGTKS